MALCVIDKRLPEEISRYLSKRGVELVFTKELSKVSSPLSTHTDIQITRVGERLVCAPSLYSYYQSIFSDVLSGEKEPRDGYPSDCVYNCLTVGNYFFHRLDVTDPVVLEVAKKDGFTLVPVNQGYSACSTLVLADDAVITADCGMEKEFLKLGIEVLKISSGEILLKNYPYGFIGGCGGRAFGDEILFFGAASKEIQCFIQKHGKTPVFFDIPLEDYGGLIFLEDNQ